MERRRKRTYFKSKGGVPKKPKSRTRAQSGSIDGLGRLINSRKLSPGIAARKKRVKK